MKFPFALSYIYIGITILIAVILIINEIKVSSAIGKNFTKIRIADPKIKAFRNLALLLTVLSLAVLSYFLFANNMLLPRAIFYSVFFALLSFYFERNSYLWLSDYGMSIGKYGFHSWKSIDRIEWDKDIGQKSWGVKIYRSGKNIPSKFYVSRNLKEQIENKIVEYKN